MSLSPASTQDKISLFSFSLDYVKRSVVASSLDKNNCLLSSWKLPMPLTFLVLCNIWKSDWSSLELPGGVIKDLWDFSDSFVLLCGAHSSLTEHVCHLAQFWWTLSKKFYMDNYWLHKKAKGKSFTGTLLTFIQLYFFAMSWEGGRRRTTKQHNNCKSEMQIKVQAHCDC